MRLKKIIHQQFLVGILLSLLITFSNPILLTYAAQTKQTVCGTIVLQSQTLLYLLVCNTNFALEIQFTNNSQWPYFFQPNKNNIIYDATIDFRNPDQYQVIKNSYGTYTLVGIITNFTGTNFPNPCPVCGLQIPPTSTSTAIPPTLTTIPSRTLTPTLTKTTPPTLTRTLTFTSTGTNTATKETTNTVTSTSTATLIKTSTAVTQKPDSIQPGSSPNDQARKDCVSGKTGFDICILEKGDILLEKGPLPWPFDIGRVFNGTYWFHAAIYLGNNQIAHARGYDPDVKGQVKVDSIFETSWWTGEQIKDWAVIRPNTPIDVKNAAASYAEQKANQDSPPVRYDILPLFHRMGEDSFYCSQFVWKAYEKQGVDLEVNLGFFSRESPYISPDDLYYSTTIGKSKLINQKKIDQEVLERIILRIFSPANLLITSPDGKKTGIDPLTGRSYNENPMVEYSGPDAEPETISFMVPASRKAAWNLTLTGHSDGSYKLDIEVMQSTGKMENKTITSSISKGEKISYQVDTKGILLIRQSSTNVGLISLMSGAALIILGIIGIKIFRKRKKENEDTHS